MEEPAVRRESQVEESQSLSQEINIVSQESHSVSQESKSVSQESHSVSQESKIVSQESHSVSQESKIVSQESKIVTKASQSLTQETIQTNNQLVEQQTNNLLEEEETNNLLEEEQANNLLEDQQTNNLLGEQTNNLLEDQQAGSLSEEQQTNNLLEGEQTKNFLEEEQTSNLLKGEQTNDLLEEEQTSTLLEEEQTGHLLEEQTNILLDEEQTNNLLEEEQTNNLVEEKQTNNLLEDQQEGNLLEEQQANNLLEGEQTNNLLEEQLTNNLLEGKQTNNLLEEEQTNNLLEEELEMPPMVETLEVEQGDNAEIEEPVNVEELIEKFENLSSVIQDDTETDEDESHKSTYNLDNVESNVIPDIINDNSTSADDNNSLENANPQDNNTDEVNLDMEDVSDTMSRQYTGNVETDKEDTKSLVEDDNQDSVDGVGLDETRLFRQNTYTVEKSSDLEYAEGDNKEMSTNIQEEGVDSIEEINPPPLVSVQEEPSLSSLTENEEQFAGEEEPSEKVTDSQGDELVREYSDGDNEKIPVIPVEGETLTTSSNTGSKPVIESSSESGVVQISQVLNEEKNPVESNESETEEDITDTNKELTEPAGVIPDNPEKLVVQIGNTDKSNESDTVEKTFSEDVATELNVPIEETKEIHSDESEDLTEPDIDEDQAKVPTAELLLDNNKSDLKTLMEAFTENHLTEPEYVDLDSQEQLVVQSKHVEDLPSEEPNLPDDKGSTDIECSDFLEKEEGDAGEESIEVEEPCEGNETCPEVSNSSLTEEPVTASDIDELQPNVETPVEHAVVVPLSESEPIYSEAGIDTDKDNTEAPHMKSGEETKIENQYVTAEEVRIHKHKDEDKEITGGKDMEEEEDNSKDIEEHIGAEPFLICPTIIPTIAIPVCSSTNPKEEGETVCEVEKDTEDVSLAGDESKQEVTADDTYEGSKEVDQLVRDIQDPELDSSLEDIAAMVDGREVVEEEKKVDDDEESRISPEFATAAGLLDKNPDKGFDPEDPAVKGMEDWECTNLDTSIDSLESKENKFQPKLKQGVFKKNRWSRGGGSDEGRSLLDREIIGEEGREGDGEGGEDKGCFSCFNSWLLYIFVKIFD